MSVKLFFKRVGTDILQLKLLATIILGNTSCDSLGVDKKLCRISLEFANIWKDHHILMVLNQDSMLNVHSLFEICNRWREGKSLTGRALSQISELELPFGVSDLLNGVNTALDNGTS